MAEEPVGRGRFRVGDLLVDVGLGRVTRGEVELPFPRLTFDALVVLIREAPNVVSLDMLMQRVWPGLVVSSETVSQRIKLLRSVLGDDSRAPRYILGVRGRGYRLIAPVERLSDDECAATGPALPPDALDAAPGQLPPVVLEGSHGAGVDRRPWPRPVAIAAALVALIAAGWQLGAVITRRAESPDPAAVAADLPPRSIAVLPFENLSTEQGDELLAIGIADNVLHQLAGSRDLLVISRTSSFAAGDPGDDALAVGERLGARYLLEGSLQREAERIRVTAQLIDATTGRHVWSGRFDRRPRDLFALQDEIAVEVARALESHLQAGANERLVPRGTRRMDAWLAYQQGRRSMSTRRLADLARAEERFRVAIREDPQFAAAHVELAEAQVLQAFSGLSESWFINSPPLDEADRTEIDASLARAIELDPDDGDAYIVRAWLAADPVSAALDYRRGLELKPSSSEGLERLARVLFFHPDAQGRIWDPEKREEAFTLIDRALALDPLVPSTHLTKGLMVLYGRSDHAGADALYRQVLELDPNFYPALARLGELRWCCEGRFAESAKYLEDALAIEPAAAWVRHFLVRAYLDMRDLDAARKVASALDPSDGAGRVSLALAEGNVQEAARLASLPNEPLTGLNVRVRTGALLLAALRSGRVDELREELERRVNLRWAPDGTPLYSDRSHDKGNVVALGAVYLQTGEREAGRRLIEDALRQILREARDYGRGEMWYGMTMPAALAWLGEGEAAIAALQRSFELGSHNDWYYRLELDPAFDRIRGDERFQALLRQERAHAAEQRALLEQMRSRGELPARSVGIAGDPVGTRGRPGKGLPDS